jgi:tRNA(Ser,Leu) C12 N-acetylase TAN1
MSYTAKKWTTDEINKAVELFRKGKDYTYISGKIEDRSAFAVQCKMEFYVFDKINNGTSYETLSSDLNRSEEELKKMYASQVKRNPGKPISTNSLNSAETITPSPLNLIPSPNNMYGMINRIITPYVEFHENLEKLKNLSSNETINKKTYKGILKILELRDADDEKFLEQLKKTVETKRITPVKSDSKTDESDIESEEESEEKNKKVNNTKKSNSEKQGSLPEKQGSTKINIPRKRIL